MQPEGTGSQALRRVSVIMLAVAIAIVAQVSFARRTTQNDALLLSVVAGLLMACAIGARAWPADVDGDALPDTRLPSRASGYWAIVGSVLIALTASIWLSSDWKRFLDQAVVLYGFAAILAGFGFSRVEGWRWGSTVRAVAQRLAANWLEVLAVVAILVFAAWMRFGRLDYYPTPDGVCMVDEAQVGAAAVEILAGARPWQYPESVYAAALSFRLFGASMLTLRLPFALYGTLMIIPFYLLARMLTGRRAALAATLLFAASRWEAAGSRVVIAANADALVELVAIYLVYRGWRTGGGLNYVVAGALLVFGLYGYAGFRIVPIFVVLLLCWKIAVELWRAARATAAESQSKWQRFRSVHLRGILILFLAIGLFVLPFLAITARDPVNALTERFASTLPFVTAQDKSGAIMTALENLRPALLLFNGSGEYGPGMNISEMPMLDPITGVLFLLALIAGIVFVLRGDTALPVVWFAMTLVGGAVLTRNMPTYRILGLVPAVYLLIAYLLGGLWRRLDLIRDGKWLRVASVAIAVAVLAAAFLNARTFFVQQINMQDVRAAYGDADALTAAYIGRQTGKPYVYLIRVGQFFLPRTDYGWMARFPSGRVAYRLGDVLPSRQNGGADALYGFMWPFNDGSQAALVQQVYPLARCEHNVASWGTSVYLSCRVAAADIGARQGLRASYYQGSAIQGEPIVQRQDAALDFAWDARTAPFDGAFSAVWQGSIYVASTPITLGVESTWPLSVEIDGQKSALVAGGGEKALDLAQGWHTITARMTGASASGVTRLYEVSRGRQQPLDPTRFLNETEVHGMLGRFYAGEQLQGQALAQRIDPFMDFLAIPENPDARPVKDLAPGPFSAEWTARLRIDSGGSYRFRVNATSGQAALFIDSRPLTSTVLAGGDQTTSAESVVDLTHGDHILRVTYTFKQGYYARAWLYWAPPGGDMQPIPSEVLSPLTP